MVVDNLSGKISLIVYADPAEPNAYWGAHDRLQALRRKLRDPVAIPYQTGDRGQRRRERIRSRSATRRPSRRSREYIAAGDVMQVVHIAAHAAAVLRAAAFAVPRAALAQPVAVHVLLRLRRLSRRRRIARDPGAQGRVATVTLRPIAGTRPRGATREADEALATELLADPKEVAEHVMLVDLGRNDVGRVAQTGTVQVTERMVIERYSHVMHIVSNVEGTLKPGLTQHRRAARGISRGHGQRRAESARDGNHRRAGADASRHLCRRGRLHRLPGRHGHRDRAAHGGDQGRRAVRAGRRRHRRTTPRRTANGRRR